jgi:hypothetical protein
MPRPYRSRAGGAPLATPAGAVFPTVWCSYPYQRAVQALRPAPAPGACPLATPAGAVSHLLWWSAVRRAVQALRPAPAPGACPLATPAGAVSLPQTP